MIYDILYTTYDLRPLIHDLYTREVAELCFTGIASQLGGLGFEQIALRSLSVHDRGFSPDGGLTVKSLFASLPNEGKYHYRQGGRA